LGRQRLSLAFEQVKDLRRRFQVLTRSSALRIIVPHSHHFSSLQLRSNLWHHQSQPVRLAFPREYHHCAQATENLFCGAVCIH
jgi:hypothetical protein